MCGWERKHVVILGRLEERLIFIYTPVISLSLASKPRYAENRTILLAIILRPTVALFSAVFALILESLQAY